MIVQFYSFVNRDFMTECLMKYPPCTGDHVNIQGTEWVVCGRVIELDGRIKVFMRKATRNDITYM